MLDLEGNNFRTISHSRFIHNQRLYTDEKFPFTSLFPSIVQENICSFPLSTRQREYQSKNCSKRNRICIKSSATHSCTLGSLNACLMMRLSLSSKFLLMMLAIEALS